eukprot:TRINITY_DN2776_c0_g1_i1.p1 TRINITY_DN2776_c0_g1~~TRINITY_DN2776_c0_g1_i1.p1  ORF type:complete len:452 (+),score=158.06 TRINITY_DN2776_c0_g1_i1:63-1358(+)
MSSSGWTSQRQPGQVYIPEKKPAAAPAASGTSSAKGKILGLFGKSSSSTTVASRPTSNAIPPASYPPPVSTTLPSTAPTYYNSPVDPVPVYGSVAAAPAPGPMGPPPPVNRSSKPLPPPPAGWIPPTSSFNTNPSPLPLPGSEYNPSFSSPSYTPQPYTDLGNNNNSFSNFSPSNSMVGSSNNAQLLFSTSSPQAAPSYSSPYQSPSASSSGAPSYSMSGSGEGGLLQAPVLYDRSVMLSALSAARDCNDIGIETLDELNSQADTLDQAEADVEAVHLQLDRAKVQLNSVKGLHGRALNFITPTSAKKQNEIAWSKEHERPERGMVIENHSGGLGSNSLMSVDSNLLFSSHDPFRKDTADIYNDNSLKGQLRQQDNDIDELSRLMGNVQNIAGTMNQELNRQNSQIDSITLRTQHAAQRTFDTNYKIDRML